MFRFLRQLLLFLLLPVSGYCGLGNPDLTARHADFNDQRHPMKMHEMKRGEMKMNQTFSDKRFPLKQWDSRYNSLGRKRAPIEMKERSAKSVRKPEVVKMKRVESEFARDNQRKVYLRNGEKLKGKELLPRYRDAKVTHINEMSRPEMSPKSQMDEPSMREINRFSFQRNHSTEAGQKVDRAGTKPEKN